jgi:hypothetical protein
MYNILKGEQVEDAIVDFLDANDFLFILMLPGHPIVSKRSKKDFG